MLTAINLILRNVINYFTKNGDVTSKNSKALKILLIYIRCLQNVNFVTNLLLQVLQHVNYILNMFEQHILKAFVTDNADLVA